MKPTWWATQKGKTRPIWAVVADSVEEAQELLATGPIMPHLEGYASGGPPDWGLLTLELASDTEPCKSCPHFETCMGLGWDSRRAGDPGGKVDDLASVHTCKTCMEKTLEQFTSVERWIVPDACPRWGPNHGSMVDCGGCRGEREQIKREHPRYQDKIAASQQMSKAFLASVTARLKLGPDVTDLDAHKGMKDACMGMAESYSAFKDVDLSNPEVAATDGLINVLLFHTLTIPELREAWEKIGDELKVTFVWDWLEALYLAQKKYPGDHVQITHRWVLALTDHRMAWGWTRMSIPARKMLIRSWEALVRESF